MPCHWSQTETKGEGRAGDGREGTVCPGKELGPGTHPSQGPSTRLTPKSCQRYSKSQLNTKLLKIVNVLHAYAHTCPGCVGSVLLRAQVAQLLLEVVVCLASLCSPQAWGPPHCIGSAGCPLLWPTPPTVRGGTFFALDDIVLAIKLSR